MIRPILVFCVLSVAPGLAAGADYIVSAGEVGSFFYDTPYQPGMAMEMTVGYGHASNTIGDGVWFSGPGDFDLTGDPDFGGFLSLAQNGVSDPLFITLAQDGGPVETFAFSNSGWEWYWLGSWPDLMSLEVTGLRMNVSFLGPYTVTPTVEGTEVVVQFLVVGTPEPAAVLLWLVGWTCVWTRRNAGISCKTLGRVPGP